MKNLNKMSKREDLGPLFYCNEVYNIPVEITYFYVSAGLFTTKNIIVVL